MRFKFFLKLLALALAIFFIFVFYTNTFSFRGCTVMISVLNSQTFGRKTEEQPKDFVYKPTLKNKAGASIHTAKNLPDYVKRGMQGDPDFNFFEFMKISKIPYFLGGPGLVATIMAGSNLFDIRANKAAKFNGKGMALGCACYYLMTGLAKACIDTSVKLFRGLDLNHPISTVAYNKPYDNDGHSTFKKESHNLFESSKFIRWNFVTPDDPSFNYDEIQKKMGIPEDAQNPNDMMRPIISSTIKRANAWKYLTSAFAVMMGVGLGNQTAMKEQFMTGAFSGLKKFSPKKAIKEFVPKVAEPLKNSFVSLWKGSDTISSKITGKVAILGFAASLIAANISILSNSKVKETK